MSQLFTASTAEDRSGRDSHLAPNFPWYAIRVRSNFEKTAGLGLRNRGFQEYVPLYRKRIQWCDRLKELEIPLFPGYLFCRVDLENRLPVLTTPGVVSIVAFGRDFIPIPEDEVATIQRALASGTTVLPWPYLRVGQRVRIEHGSMTGIEGILLRVRDDFRLIISVDILMRSVAVHVDRDWIRPIG